MNENSTGPESTDVPASRRAGPERAGGEDAATQPAVDRLRAADPAAHAQVDAAVLRAAVDARVAAPAPADELAARRARRWTSWPARVAGVAAAALVIGGGGGYALGASGSGDEPADVLVSQEADDSGTSAVAPAPRVGSAAGGGADAMGAPMSPERSMAADVTASAADGSWPWSGRTVFTSSGLSSDGGSAAAWGFDAAAAYSADTVARAAAALGVEGSPSQANGSWQVGPNDGSAANVSVYADGTASLSYYDPATDPWSCAPVPGDPETTTEEQADPGTKILPAPDPCTQRDLGPAPSQDEATARLRELMTTLGLDPDAFEMVPESYDPTSTYVAAYQVLDGRRTGLTWSASFTGGGLQSLYGPLAPLTGLGEYDVISPAAAVERLGDPRYGAGWGGPMAYVDGAEPVYPEGVPAPEPTVPPTLAPGGAIAWPVDTVTITQARLVTSLQTLPGGAAVLLPTYELINDDGAIWSVVAVAESQLDFTAGR